MQQRSAFPDDVAPAAFNSGDTTLYVSAFLRGRVLEASARPVVPVNIHLHVYEFRHGGQSLGCPLEVTDYHVNLGLVIDPQARNNMILEILADARYNDPDIQWFWREKLNEYVFNVGQNAFNVGVAALDLNVVIHIRNMARQLRETAEMEQIAELLARTADEGIGGHLSGVPASVARSKLEVVKYDGVGGEFAENPCAICLEEFQVGMEVTRMPCKHAFHGICLARWLEKSRFCPLCRRDMSILCQGSREELA